MRKATGLLLAGLLVLAGCGEASPDSDGTTPVSPTPTATSPSPTPSPTASPEQRTEAATYLLIGTDSREGGDPADWTPGSQRSDVIMVVETSEDGQSVTVMSLPRDSWVEIDGHGQNKLNAAYSFGGPDLMKTTVEELLGTSIDHTLVVNFESFVALSDLVGPVTVETSDGPVELEGEEALSFVRERKSLPRGDFDRVRRQQAYLVGFAQALRSADLGPTDLAQLARSASESVAIDGSSGPGAVGSLVSLLSNLMGQADAEATMFVAPNEGTGWSDDGQSIVLLDEEALAELGRAYDEGSVADWVAGSDVDTLDGRPVD